MKKILAILNQYQFFMFWALMLGLFGYSLWQVQKISQPKADEAYVKSQQRDQITTIQIKDSLRQQIEKLEDTPVDTTPNNVGTSDPFNP